MKFIATFFWILTVAAQAEERFTFALPEVEGRITLGVFDSNEKLVRKLYTLSAVKDFDIDDNGLIAKWDGKNDQGERLPAGPYFVRGFVVGDEVEAEGVAYHFNDWIVDEESPRIAWLEAIQRLEDDSVLTLARSAAAYRLVFRYTEKEGFVWATELKDERTASPALLGADESTTVVFSGSGFYSLEATTGQISGPTTTTLQPGSMALTEGKLFVTTDGGLKELSLPSFEEVKAVAAPLVFDTLAASGKTILAASGSQGGVSVFSSGTWSEIAIPARIKSLSGGKSDTIWVVGQEPEKQEAFAGQFARDGEFLRSYRTELPPRTISASRTSEEVAVLEENDTEQRLLMLQLDENKEEDPDWEIVFEKVIIRCAQFGIRDGKLIPDAGAAPQLQQLPFQTTPGGLNKTSEEVIVRVAFDDQGCWLQTPDGLQLLRVSVRPGTQRVVMEQGEKLGSLKIYAGDGVVVSEYLATGLQNLVSLDIGEIDLE